jgi:hypothetical protein
MKYYLDTEFIEGSQFKSIFGFDYKTKPTIELISIGIVDEEGKEFYAINKEFNLAEAWNRWQYDTTDNGLVKVYWIREHVLRSIFNELNDRYEAKEGESFDEFNYDDFRFLLDTFGSTKNDIAAAVQHFMFNEPVVYTYYGDYDWVALCWLYGKMIDLPKHFPKYARDLKQSFDELVEQKTLAICRQGGFGDHVHVMNNVIIGIKGSKHYPINTSEHNALTDAKWNKALHDYLNNTIR